MSVAPGDGAVVPDGVSMWPDLMDRAKMEYVNDDAEYEDLGKSERKGSEGCW